MKSNLSKTYGAWGKDKRGKSEISKSMITGPGPGSYNQDSQSKYNKTMSHGFGFGNSP